MSTPKSVDNYIENEMNMYVMCCKCSIDTVNRLVMLKCTRIYKRIAIKTQKGVKSKYWLT